MRLYFLSSSRGLALPCGSKFPKTLARLRPSVWLATGWLRCAPPRTKKSRGLSRGNGSAPGRKILAARYSPAGDSRSTLAVEALNFCVRDGNRCDCLAMVTRKRKTEENRLSENADRIAGALPRPAAPGGRTVIFETESIVWLRSERLAHGQASRTISTGRVRPLLSVRLPPIKVVVFDHPSGALRPGRSYLWVGLALRCIQRLSVPDLATRLCPWQDNRHTIGPSFPVLSY